MTSLATPGGACPFATEQRQWKNGSSNSPTETYSSPLVFGAHGDPHCEQEKIPSQRGYTAIFILEMCWLKEAKSQGLLIGATVAQVTGQLILQRSGCCFPIASPASEPYLTTAPMLILYCVQKAGPCSSP